MKLPNLSSPVVRNVNARFASEGVNPSGIACSLCKSACNLAPGGAIGKMLCLKACDATVC